MTTQPDDAPYTLKSLETMLGISPGIARSLVRAGFVTPSRGARNELRFSFRDIVLLRTAQALRTQRIAPRTILRSLRQLRRSLPAELPLSGLRVTAVGSTVAVREGDVQWEPESGQLLIDFDVVRASGSIRMLAHRQRASRAADDADTHFRRAQRLESEGSAEQAEAAYLSTLAIEPTHADARLNLGALLCDLGRSADAVAVYREGLRCSPAVGSLHFNLAVALEDLGEREAALESYERCLALEPKSADAHFNAARLHDQLGHAQQAVRHFNAYRRLQRR
ncbi:MAG: tetratricopeptide repeat protein [Burkholderiaceae bacterium]|nr:tetratricopeptide repeat protein [Burkholderiaceae bacterium]